MTPNNLLAGIPFFGTVTRVRQWDEHRQVSLMPNASQRLERSPIYAFVGGGLGQLTGEAEIESSESLCHPNEKLRRGVAAPTGGRAAPEISGGGIASTGGPRGAQFEFTLAATGVHPSGLMPAFLMIGHHFSTSAFCRVPSAFRRLLLA